MIAIRTKYHGPTNTRGSRISAETTTPRPSTGKRDRVSIPYPHELSPCDGHVKAAKALIAKHGFPTGDYALADMGDGYVLAPMYSGRANIVEITP